MLTMLMYARSSASEVKHSAAACVLCRNLFIRPLNLTNPNTNPDSLTEPLVIYAQF